MSQKKKNKTIEIPNDIWVDFVQVLYMAVQHITPTEDNQKVMFFLKSVVAKAFENGDILVDNGKIISKENLK